MSAADAVAIRGPSVGARLAGLGSVFGKTIRDSRRAVLAIGIIAGLLPLAVASTLATQFPTEAERLKLAQEMAALPAIFLGLLGEPLRVETMPGFISWRTLNFMPIFIGIWSAMALSGTIAGETGRGSLEILAAAPVRRWWLATAKASAHVLGLAIAMTIAAVLTVLGTVLLGTVEGDQARLVDSLSEFAWIAVGAVFAGSIAFAVGSVASRGVAAGTGVVILIAVYVVNGFAASVPFFQSIEFLSIFDWTAGHRPLAGVYDWAPVGVVAVVDVALLAAGVGLFVARDIGVGGLGGPALASGTWSTRGAALRSFAERLPAALPFGLGIGAYGFFIAVSADGFAKLLDDLPQFADLIAAFFPGFDLRTAAGVLELLFVSFGALLLGLGAAAIAHGWGADERDGRLEVILSAPISRVGLAVRSGVGTYLAVMTMAAVMAAPIAIGTIARGDDPGGPIVGFIVLGVYATALAGIGLAVGGLLSPRWPGIVVGLYVIGSFLLEVIGTPLKLPDTILDLSLARHLGRPMVGDYDEVGLALFAVLILGGLALCAVGFRRRDLRA
ncbi:MAG TPA: ABC transporter permease subunit [Candidatus Limnocylindrales bacterium]|nr:ABC transporter permease subunit [Candidatus Limnocylindrales bacterium]